MPIPRSDEPLWIPESAFQDPRFRLFNTPSAPSFEVLLLTPIVVRGQLTGIISAQHRLRHQITRSRATLVSFLSSLLGIQMDVFRLRKENISLKAKLESCDEIKEATQILRHEMDLSQADAYLLLQRKSRNMRKPMREVAASIILANSLKHASNANCPTRGLPNPQSESLS
jgi:uroporphyrinogen-III synthase